METSEKAGIPELEGRARSIRKRIILMNSKSGQGHTGADLSETDILTALYFRIMNCKEDHFILSKGHGVGGYYCALAEAGYFPEEWLDSYLGFESKLPGHPVRQKTPGIEFNTGALGHGLSVSCGLALSMRKNKKKGRMFTLLGDGELQEGSNWEAAMAASYFKLGNLTAIVDRNRLQLADRTEKIMGLEPLADKWRAFGFEVSEVDGNSMAELVACLESLDYSGERPHLVLAHTVKGKGVSFIEDNAPWHHKVPSGDEVVKAIEELE